MSGFFDSLCLKTKNCLARELGDGDNGPRYNLLLLGCVFSFLLVLFSLPMPTDDLYRHIVSHLYGYDYRQLYPFMDFPSWNYWIGYEKALAWLQGPPLELSRITVVRIVQLTALVLSYLVVVFSFWKVLKTRADGQYWVMAILLVVFPLFAYRAAANGRPEIFATIWMISALLVSAPLWVFLGALIAPIYGLIPIYAIGAAFLNTTLRKRVLAFVLVLAIQVGFWLWFTDGKWPEIFGYLHRWVEGRSLPIAENSSLLIMMLFQLKGIAAVGLLVLAWSVYRPAEAQFRTRLLPALFVVIAFAAPNMSRYMAIVVFTLLIIAAICLAQRPEALRLSSWVIRVFLFLAVAFTGTVKVSNKPPVFDIPVGSRVFALDGQAALALPFYSSGLIEVIPSMEHGGNAQVIKEALLMAAKTGTLDCGILKEFEITHVVEKSLKGEPPACLELQKTDRAWRMWRVR